MNINTIVAAVLLVAGSQANAQAYKCAGPGGKIEYRDIPCSSSQKIEKTFNQEVGAPPPSPKSADSAGVSGAVPVAGNPSSRFAPRDAEQNPNAMNPPLAANSEATVVDSRSDPIAGGVCSRNISWDSCRKLGIESIVDCKRMDEDAVFRASVLQSKGIQCRSRIGRFPIAQ